MRRAIALIVLCTMLLALGAGAVWAATLIGCPNILGTYQCLGTSGGDVMTATDANDSIAGLEGRDRINDAAKQDMDTINGGLTTTPSMLERATRASTTATWSIAARAGATGSSSTREKTATR